MNIFTPSSPVQRWKNRRMCKKALSDTMPDYTFRAICITLIAAFIVCGMLLFLWDMNALADTADTTIPTEEIAVGSSARIWCTLNVREGAGKEYKVETELHWKNIVKIVEVKDGWALVKWPNHKETLGWVSMEYLDVFSWD